MDAKRFNEFAQERIPVDGEKIKIESILNVEVLITGYSLSKSKYDKNTSGKVLTLQVEISGVKRIIFTGSDVLIDQLENTVERSRFYQPSRK